MEENTAVLDTPEVVKHTGAEWYRDVSLEDAEVFIRSNLQSAVRSVIATGFYLKHIRDNELYLEAGYKNVNEYAMDRFGLSASATSRYITRNTRFSRGGNSPLIDDRFKDFSKSQLQEMLGMSDEQLEQVTPDMTVREIRSMARPKEVPYIEIPGQTELKDIPGVMPEERAESFEASTAELFDVEEDENKRSKTDFVLWFTKSKFDDQELKWDSPWGVGYPGWHIECSCISMKHLGEYLDIHCGGVDNIFPHHTNEIAQSEAYTGHKWCNYWFDVQHLNEQRGKMSKSAGGFLTVSSLEEQGYNPLVYRMFCLQSHYRKPLVFSYEVLDNVKIAYEKLQKRIAALSKEGEVDQDVFTAYQDKFAEAMGSDINTSQALTVLYDVLKADTNDATKRALIEDFDQVLSLGLLAEEEGETGADPELVAWIAEKIAERKAAKKEKDFAKADAIRQELLDKGIEVKDTREGTVWTCL